MSHVPSNYGAGGGGGGYDQSYGNGMGGGMGDMSNEHVHGHGHGAAASTSMTRGQGQGAGSGHYFDPYAASFVPAAAAGSHRYGVASAPVQGVAGGVVASQSSAAGSINASAAVPAGLHDPTQMTGAHHGNYDAAQQGQGQGQGQVMVINGQTVMMMGGGGMQPAAAAGSQMGYMGQQQYGQQVMPMYGGSMGVQSQSMPGGQQHQHMYMGHPAGGRGGGLGQQQRFDGQGSPGRGGRGGKELIYIPTKRHTD